MEIVLIVIYVLLFIFEGVIEVVRDKRNESKGEEVVTDDPEKVTDSPDEEETSNN
jgi:Na+-transporting methylmalonyl-CoA/oxaloacetate decarboxylase gamma subunit